MLGIQNICYFFIYYLDILEKDLLQNMETKPLDFLFIGAPKTGSTSLFFYLREHPLIYIPIEKELPYFNNNTKYEQGWNVFSQTYFNDASYDSMWGKITPNYWGDNLALERIKKTMPSTKIIIMLRNPVDQFVSYYRMMFRRGLTKDQLNIENLEKSAFLRDGLKMSLYSDFLTRIYRTFTSEKILVHFSEHFKEHRQEVLDSVLCFLGLASGYQPKCIDELFNIGGDVVRFPKFTRFIGQSRVIDSLTRSMPRKLHKTLHRLKLRYQNSFETIPNEPRPLSKELRQYLVNYFRRDVLKIEKILSNRHPWQEFHD